MADENHVAQIFNRFQEPFLSRERPSSAWETRKHLLVILNTLLSWILVLADRFKEKARRYDLTVSEAYHNCLQILVNPSYLRL